MKLEILLSTMNLKSKQENRELLKKMNIEKQNTLTINQITQNKIEKFEELETKNKIISRREKGLSKSRNLAIKSSKADICILADDDVIYKKGFEKIIQKEYEKQKNYDIICFYVESSNKQRKVKRMITSKVGKIRAMKICSFQITFRREKIKNNKIEFDENFGVGTYYDRGEETIFLWDCLKKGLKIKFINKKIGDINQDKSSWFEGYNEEFLKKQGVVFYRLSPKWYYILILQYALRKYKLFQENLKIVKAIKTMQQGVKEYEK